jgi:ABC-type transport system involved in cytochrome bd biosynthesis fused ATPase/permease subunit
MLKRWRELVPFIRQFRGHLKWMVLGTLSGLLAVASAVGLLALSGWFISAATYAGLTAMTVQLFNFFYPGIGVRVFAIGRTLARYVERIVSHDVTFRILQSDPNIGCIQIGGVDVRNFGESDLRRHISVVAQQPHMFNATLRENLLMARPGAGEDELLEALKFAQLLSFVSDLPDGLDTWIGEAAKLLSGGQARRVAVARAILHNGPLWVLDEPTEGLDPVTEGRMMAAIKAQTVDRSLLLITHRLIDLHWMDDIVMLDKGRIVAQGTHEELLIGNSQYASMHRRIP